jgi:hypothetical protein
MFKLFKKFKKFKFTDSINSISNLKQDLNTNKLLAGFVMIVMNIGSRYIELKLTKGQELLLKNIAREVLIFTIAFINTKDIVSSIIITLIFIILANYLLNEESKYNILPNKYKQLSQITSNNDKIVSDYDISNAYETLKKAKQQINNYNKLQIIESFNNVSYF